MLLFACSFAISLLFTGVLMRFGCAWAVGFGDTHPPGPQVFHRRAAPRLGGVAIFAVLPLLTLAAWWRSPGQVDEVWALTTLLLLCGLPAFVVGATEDVTKQVAPLSRMAAAAVSALLAVAVLDAIIQRTDLWGLDWIASYPIGAAALAIFAVTGIANSINIIDGFNGLASMCVAMMLLAMGYVANAAGDSALTMLTLAGAGAVLGFFVWNFPRGLIFLGDGGAYFLGFLVAEIGVLLLQRNPEISPLCPLLIVIYPVFETLFSMYRRKILRGRPVGQPDGLHLHSLVYRRLTRWAVDGDDDHAATLRNSMTAPYLWALCLLAIVPAVIFWNDSRVLGGFIVLFAVTYTVLYWRLVRFKTPAVFRIVNPLRSGGGARGEAPVRRG